MGLWATARRVVLPLLATGLLAGCLAPAMEGVKRDAVDGLAPAPLPRYVVGDRRYLGNGRREKVVAVEAGVVTWRTSGGTRFQALPNFILPDLARESARRRIVNRFEAEPGLLWPLREGNRGWFAVERVALDKRTGEVKRSSRDWRCKVDGGWRIEVAAGSFLTHRVVCDRTNAMGKFRQRRTWYYAPAIGDVVLRLSESPGRSARRRELLAFHPSLEHFSATERKAYRTHFQRTMENLPAGETHWFRGDSPGHRVGVTPIRTLKLENGRFCRTYRLQVIAADGSRRDGAGIVCRDAKGRWRVPGRTA